MIPFGVTVGDDVFTVHKFLVVGDEKYLPLCGAEKDIDETTAWRRAVNCEACLRLPDLGPEGDCA
ncbi:hypothetical protein A6A06_09075 [Streptomyces sp. CB02923]|uniref:hypothetical protein n=1 Tax=Streptomyces sp. CB02923 TaxID=1718985 RepID=UPI00093EEF16|nr:hypothetical protein [Streptomyces sp. CB02923]OKI04855.1 hypothetical protein A6A06_09075 [Streptomyces sp. CB02923]